MAIDIHDLRSMALFGHLTDANLAEFCERSSNAVFAANQTVYRIGDRASSSYLVLEGRVRVYIPDRYGHSLVIDELDTGQFFGELIGNEEVTCTSTAVTLTEAHLLILNRANLSYLLAKNPEAVFILMTALQKHLQRVQSLLRNSRAITHDA